MREGSETAGLKKLGDGMSDIFLITLEGPSGYVVRTSSAVLVLRCSDSTVNGYFRLQIRGNVSDDLPHNISAPALQTVLMALASPAIEMQVNRQLENGNYLWFITYLNSFDDWNRHSLTVISCADQSLDMSKLLKLEKAARAGNYPVSYKVWTTGSYTLTISQPDATLISGAVYTIDVINGAVDSFSSYAFGQGLTNSIAGEPAFFFVQAMDSRQLEIQTLKTSGEGLE
jgi:hypothetical protein